MQRPRAPRMMHVALNPIFMRCPWPQLTYAMQTRAPTLVVEFLVIWHGIGQAKYVPRH
jgi:hypothetical protein